MSVITLVYDRKKENREITDRHLLSPGQTSARARKNKDERNCCSAIQWWRSHTMTMPRRRTRMIQNQNQSNHGLSCPCEDRTEKFFGPISECLFLTYSVLARLSCICTINAHDWQLSTQEKSLWPDCSSPKQLPQSHCLSHFPSCWGLIRGFKVAFLEFWWLKNTWYQTIHCRTPRIFLFTDVLNKTCAKIDHYLLLTGPVQLLLTEMKTLMRCYVEKISTMLFAESPNVIEKSQQGLYNTTDYSPYNSSGPSSHLSAHDAALTASQGR